MPALKPGRSSSAKVTAGVPASARLGAFHVLSCADDRKKVKETNERNNCRGSRSTVAVRAPTGSQPTDPGPPADPDADNDGVPDASDCAPNDATVSPGANDPPDTASKDSNCDGIDGDPTKAVFASPSGSDDQPGTQAQPKRTIGAAIQAAAGMGRREVYAAVGGYLETLTLVDGIGVYGGYDPADWSRSTLLDTVVDNASAVDNRVEAAIAVNVAQETVLQRLTLIARASSASGVSVYALRAQSSPGLVLDGVTARAGGTAEGAPGTGAGGAAASGGNGAAGGAGVENSAAAGCDTNPQPTQGPAGTSPVGREGGLGGAPGVDTDPGSAGVGAAIGGADGGTGTPFNMGDWNPAIEHVGESGSNGLPGVAGTAGSGAFGVTGYTATDGASGGNGAPGNGGGGGGGGGGGDDLCNSYGGAGGGGGGGGAGGLGGNGGESAGGSFAVYLWASDTTIRNSILETGVGGAAGTGAHGQTSGAGGAGGFGGNATRPNAGNPYGVASQDDGSNGGRGGNGGKGGDGAAGGGGAGGPSVGIVLGGGSSPTLASNTFMLLSGGAGGSSSGSGGPAGASGETFTAP